MKTLDHVGRVNQAAKLGREAKECGDLGLVLTPRGHNQPIALTPLLLETVQLGSRCYLRGCCVNAFQVSDKVFDVLVRNKAQAVP